jgi:hypothetical protein
MDMKTWKPFFEKVAESPEFRNELAELATRHGISFPGSQELSEDELDAVAGGGSLLQQWADTTSSISKKMHDAAQGIINNIGG